MSFYERFELVLSAVIPVIILSALWCLISEVFSLLVLGAPDPLDHRVFRPTGRGQEPAQDGGIVGLWRQEAVSDLNGQFVWTVLAAAREPAPRLPIFRSAKP